MECVAMAARDRSWLAFITQAFPPPDRAVPSGSRRSFNMKDRLGLDQRRVTAVGMAMGGSDPDPGPHIIMVSGASRDRGGRR
jgi:hypothetical protein